MCLHFLVFCDFVSFDFLQLIVKRHILFSILIEQGRLLGNCLSDIWMIPILSNIKYVIQFRGGSAMIPVPSSPPWGRSVDRIVLSVLALFLSVGNCVCPLSFSLDSWRIRRLDSPQIFRKARWRLTGHVTWCFIICSGVRDFSRFYLFFECQTTFYFW